MNKSCYILAFDTANEVVSVALGLLHAETRVVELVACKRIEAHRASNTKLLPAVDALMREQGIERTQIAAVACGRGPGSFTGVRICMATAKGIASALEVALVGVSTLDALAWELQAAGTRGHVLVVADAMRREVYPVRYKLSGAGIERLDVDTVVKVELFDRRVSELPEHGGQQAVGKALGEVDALSTTPRSAAQNPSDSFVSASNEPDASFAPPQFDLVAGDALHKYADIFEAYGSFAPHEQWTVEGSGLLACVQQMWQAGECDPFDAQRHNPALALPVYTRLSDAEENERKRLATTTQRDLHTGVDGQPSEAPNHHEYTVRMAPLAAGDVSAVALLEADLMAGDAWNQNMIADDLGRKDRSWWGAFDAEGGLVGYAGIQVIAGQMQLLKIAVAKTVQRQGVATQLLAQLADDARNLGANEMTLEVRAGNDAARTFYEQMGLVFQGMRPGYYQDGEDAAIYTGPLPQGSKDVAGMALIVDQAAHPSASTSTTTTAFVSSGSTVSSISVAPATPAINQSDQPNLAIRQPLILAIESSCDETAAAVVDGAGHILADAIASQIDFHARFGGVVPEIASRKHIEAICGVSQVCLERARVFLAGEPSGKIGPAGGGQADMGQVGGNQAGGDQTGQPFTPQVSNPLHYRDLDAIAVTYAPGLVGALVVGVAFAKGAAWAVNIPLIQVNHLEGHLYANKFATPDLTPPMVVSLVSGGHTMLVHVRDWGDYQVLGSTIDDAVGEAFDKVAKALGLGYPGGPIISKLAAQGNPKAIDFPRAMMHSGDLRFSLSGLKTAVATYINQQREAGNGLNLPDIAASFQSAVIDVQVAKACTALDETGAKEFCLGGGVAANPALRAAYQQACDQRGVRLTMPPASACTDNASMIALVALDRYAQGRFATLDADAFAHANLEEPY